MHVMIRGLKWKKKIVGHPRVRWWNLTKGNVTKLSKKVKVEGSYTSGECIPNVGSNDKAH